jgi:hypothetical protein
MPISCSACMRFQAAGIPVPRAFRGMGWQNHRAPSAALKISAAGSDARKAPQVSDPTFVSARLVGLAANHAYAFALVG